MLVKKYKAFFNAGIMNLFAYKFNFITWFILSVLQLLAVFFLWNAVFANSRDGMNSIINGFTFKEIIVYLSFANVFTFVSLTSETNGTIEDEIKDGTIAISFIKPISYRLRFLFITLGQCFATNVLTCAILSTQNYHKIKV